MDLLSAQGITAVNTRGGIAPAFADSFPDGVDVIVDCTGVAALISDLLPLAKEKPWDHVSCAGATYLFQGSYAGKIPLPYMDAYMKEISFLLPRDQQRPDQERVLEMLKEKKIQAADMVTRIVSPLDAPEAYREIATPGKIAGTIGFDWTRL